jgi:ElaB/YqjD/DUF883 family membrane-anchored ribosome-binding protein
MANKKKLTPEEAVKLFWAYYINYRDVRKTFSEMEKLYEFDKKSVIETVKKQATEGYNLNNAPDRETPFGAKKTLSNPYKNQQAPEREQFIKDLDKEINLAPERENGIVKAPERETPYGAKKTLSDPYKKQKAPERETQQIPTEEASAPKEEIKPATTTKAEAQAIKKKNIVNKALEYVKKNKGKGAVVGTILGLFGLGAMLSGDEEQPQAPTSLPPQQPPPQQPTEQQPAIQQPTTPVFQVADYSSEYSEELKQVQEQMLKLFQDLDRYRQMYDEVLQQYTVANEYYEKQLLQIMPAIPLLLAKTPLNNITHEDLIQHTNTLFTSMPYSVALQNVDKMMKGYYIAKVNGVDPKTLSTIDLVEIADNPVLAKSSDENLAQFLSQIAEVLKFKIKSNLDKIGAIKDAYDTRLKELQEKGKIYNDIIKSIKYEYDYKFNIEKLTTTVQTMAEKLRIMEEEKNIKGLQALQGSGKGNKKFDIRSYTQSLIEANCPKDPKTNLPDLQCTIQYLQQPR